MELVNIYDEYREVNKNYVDFIEELVNKNFEGFSEDFVMGNLENFQNSIGALKVKADDLQVEEENKDNLKDLKYLIVDTLFLTFDLNNFYKLKEFERFKMRFANYVNKRRRDEMLKSFQDKKRAFIKNDNKTYKQYEKILFVSFMKSYFDESPLFINTF